MRSHCNPTRVKWAASTGLVGALVATAGLSVALAPNVGATAACVLATDYTSSTSGSNTVLTFTNVGTCEWTVPTGVTSVTLTLVGGGGGGGAGNGSMSAPEPYGGGGGGGGEVRSSVSVSSLTAGQTVDITIGDGGLGGASAGTAGADGGQSEFGAATPEIAAPEEAERLETAQLQRAEMAVTEAWGRPRPEEWARPQVVLSPQAQAPVAAAAHIQAAHRALGSRAVTEVMAP